MLKALELYGFKSFADKTRFDFPPGITVVVGPNGSGKSNIVDAIKWVLGEQSAKSLRGKEMADVIFKGTGPGGRKMMNTAEATIIFDNAERRLPVDADEVHVTRRVYRSGEGEYLINGQPCRLKDIKDMFRGTGVGADAYSLIEQGKVDQLLQASPKDRRAIFEEAAGISRFKAKKLEAQRRLERVDQNLLRLSDIVEEVENRLKSVRAQASKARRYREYNERLQQLRTYVALTDWRSWSERLAGVEAQCAERRRLLEELAAECESAEASELEVETELISLAESIHQRESRLARNREALAARLSLREIESARRREFEEEAALHRAQMAAASGRAGDLQQRLRQVAQQVDEMMTAHRHLEDVHRNLEKGLQQIDAEWQTARDRSDQLHLDHVEQMRRVAALGNEVSRLATETAAAETAVNSLRAELEDIEGQLAPLREEFEQLQATEQELEAELHARTEALSGAHEALAQSRRLLARRQEDVAQLRGRRQGAAERVAVLEDLEHRREGVMPGVKELLEMHAAQPERPELGDIAGMVAELLRADVKSAPLVDAALGDAAQYIVLRGTSLLDAVASGALRVSGRVHLIALPRIPRRFEFRRVQWEGRPGVLGRADQFVDAAEEFAAVVEHLLGRTYFVESIEDALRYFQMAPGRARFVTLQGEIVERDGTVTIGVPSASSSFLSRRSALEQLREEIATLDHQIRDAQAEIVRHTENIERQEQAYYERAHLHREAQEAVADHRVRRRTVQEQLDQLQRQADKTRAAYQHAQARRAACSEQLDEARQELTAAEASVRQMEAARAAALGDWQRLDRLRQERLQELTRAQVDLATSEQRLTALQAHYRQLEETHRERHHAMAEAQASYQRCLERMTASDRAVLQATSELAVVYLEKEAIEREIEALHKQRSQAAERKAELSKLLAQARQRRRKWEEQRHQLELEAEQVRQQRAALAERIRDDYGVDIATLESESARDVSDEERAGFEEEIQSLRRKISNIGAVNMEALDELDDLEQRFQALHGQYRDLADAKDALERIIHRINNDSRRLFLETLEAIRANFQTIYRKAFGGGKADIVLEEGGDVLECGIEILATPPGKPTFNNSLLSGGEKALTAVALLLAIFEFRPSPFCVLDEVDAPFDEANIGRFIDVLKEFLGWTKFVIVTHSKKTMTAATTLYGVTMQESGVSKRVSVRFEDVTDDGHIRSEALHRSADESAQATSSGAGEPERGVA